MIPEIKVPRLKISHPGISKPSIKKVGRDMDKDGVMDVYDCKPMDKNKQGWVHNLKEKAAGKIQEWKQERAYQKAAEGQIKQKERAAYYRAKEKERMKYAEEKAKAERQQDIKRYKERLKPQSQPFSLMGGESAFGKSSIFPEGGLFGSPPPKVTKRKPAKRKTTKKKRRKK